jgi:FkbM family methyltransferase
LGISVQEKKVKTRLGYEMYVFPDDYIGKSIIKSGLYDATGLSFISDLLKSIKADNILDVGGNIGNHALAFGQLCNHVWSFEPNPTVHNLLVKNIETNNIKNITALPFGLSDKDTAAILHVDESGNLGASTLRDSSQQSGRNYSEKEVKLLQGDKWVASEPIKKIDYIKIDVEGHEESVINGLTNTIKKHRPIVTMEWSEKSSDREGISNSDIFKNVFNNYHIHAIFLNVDTLFWRQKPFGKLRRLWLKQKEGKRLVHAPFDPTQPTLFRPRDLLLIPKEKENVLSVNASQYV